MADPEKKPAEDAAKKPEAPKEEKKAPASTEASGDAASEKTEESSEAAASSKGGMSFSITLAVILVVLPALGFGVAWFAIAPRIKAVQKEASEGGHSESEEHSKAEAKTEHKKEPAKKADKKEHGKKEEKGKKGEGEGSENFVLDEVVVNVFNTRGTRFLRSSMEIEASPPVIQEMENHKAQVLDIITTVMSSKRLDELEAPDIRRRFRSEIIALLNSVLKGEVTNVFFKELVIQ